MTKHSNAQIQDSRAVPNIASLPADYLLPFATCYVYSPKGESEASQRSRQLCARVKSGSTHYLKSYAATVHQEVTHGSPLQDFFAAATTVLVPVPEFRAPRNATPWVAKRLASALKETGLASEVWSGLTRVSSVDWASSAWMWERPTVQQHYESLKVNLPSKAAKHILLIDGVITKGRTLAAAAMRLQEVFPQADIRAFALIRTMGFVLDIPRVLEPCQGVIHWNGEDAYRAP